MKSITKRGESIFYKTPVSQPSRISRTCTFLAKYQSYKDRYDLREAERLNNTKKKKKPWRIPQSGNNFTVLLLPQSLREWNWEFKTERTVMRFTILSELVGVVQLHYNLFVLAAVVWLGVNSYLPMWFTSLHIIFPSKGVGELNLETQV